MWLVCGRAEHGLHRARHWLRPRAATRPQLPWGKREGRGGGFTSPARVRTDYCWLAVTTPAEVAEEWGSPAAPARPAVA